MLCLQLNNFDTTWNFLLGLEQLRLVLGVGIGLPLATQVDRVACDKYLLCHMANLGWGGGQRKEKLS